MKKIIIIITTLIVSAILFLACCYLYGSYEVYEMSSYILVYSMFWMPASFLIGFFIQYGEGPVLKKVIANILWSMVLFWTLNVIFIYMYNVR